MTMMENATTSIELGVEDFVNDDPRRLTSAMRNVAAGILLLLKCVLEDRSPAGTNGVLIYMNIEEAVLPNGAVVLTAKGKKTVDVAGIKSRFKDLGIAMNWKALDTIISIRNEVEHFHTERPVALVREALASALPLIQTVLADHLQTTAADAFSPECWATLREVKEIYDRQLAECRQTFGRMEWSAPLLAEASQELRCCACGSSLVRQTDPENDEFEAMEFECADCKTDLAWDVVLEQAIVASAAEDNYRAAKDGDRPAVTQCFECGRQTFSTDDGHCLLSCGADADDMECAVCGARPESDDFYPESGMCGGCHWSYQKLLEE